MLLVRTWFQLGLIFSGMTAVGCILAAVCVLLFELSPDRGAWVGHRELVLYREGADVRFAAQHPMPIFGLSSGTDAELKQTINDWNEGIDFDTHPHLRWLVLPGFDFSLWWPFAMLLVMPAFGILQRRRAIPGGFPVQVIQGA